MTLQHFIINEVFNLVPTVIINELKSIYYKNKSYQHILMRDVLDRYLNLNSNVSIYEIAEEGNDKNTITFRFGLC